MSAARIRLVARLGRGGSTLSPFVFWSTVAHIAFLAAMIIVPTLRPKKSIPNDAIAVELVAFPQPAQAVQSPPKAAPVPEPEPEPVKPKSLPDKPKPLPEKPKPQPKSPPKAAPPETPPPSLPGAATDPAPGEASGVVGDASASVAPLAGLGSKFAWYRDSVTAALHGNWRRPVVEGLREAVEVRISFEILRDGSVRGARVDVSSGVRTLDRSALRAVADASPLPALPLDWREPTLAAAFVFRLHPE